jgi:hypothetical protein
MCLRCFEPWRNSVVCKRGYADPSDLVLCEFPAANSHPSRVSVSNRRRRYVIRVYVWGSNEAPVPVWSARTDGFNQVEEDDPDDVVEVLENPPPRLVPPPRPMANPYRRNNVAAPAAVVPAPSTAVPAPVVPVLAPAVAVPAPGSAAAAPGGDTSAGGSSSDDSSPVRPT